MQGGSSPSPDKGGMPPGSQGEQYYHKEDMTEYSKAIGVNKKSKKGKAASKKKKKKKKAKNG
jgi:hypothetical protein